MKQNRQPGLLAKALWAIFLLITGRTLFVWYRVREESRQQAANDPVANDCAPDPRPGDILLFYRPNRWRDYLIQWGTGSRYYHAALFVSPGRVLESRPKGVLESDIAGREGGYVVLPAPEHRGEAALAWAKTQLGNGYNRRGILVIALERLFVYWRINWTKPGTYTCAELVTAAYRHAGIDLAPGKEAEEVAPADLAELLPHRPQRRPRITFANPSR